VSKVYRIDIAPDLKMEIGTFSTYFARHKFRYNAFEKEEAFRDFFNLPSELKSTLLERWIEGVIRQAERKTT
jgi:hypothetical protein